MKVTAAIFKRGDKVLLMRRTADQPLADISFVSKDNIVCCKKALMYLIYNIKCLRLYNNNLIGPY